MGVRDIEFTYPRLLLGALLVVVVITGVIGLSTSSTAFGSHNPSWDGTSEIRTLARDTGATASVSQSTSEYTEVPAGDTTAFILSPTESYSAADVERLEAFLADGGTVVVAADFDQQTNDLLERLNVSARVDGRLVRDERQYYRGPSLPVASNVAESPATVNVSRLTLNHASVVQPGAESEILVNTSGFAYLDTNRNGELDDAESLREHPVVVQEPAGEGRVVVVSDPSLFINAMLDAPDNRQFARNLVAGSDTVVFDYSHRTGIPWAVAIVLTIADTPWLQFLVVAALTGVAAVAWARTELGVPTSVARLLGGDAAPAAAPVSREDVVDHVVAQHPEWDAERVERVTRGISDVPDGSDDD